MTLEDPSGRGLYALEPRGADLSPGMFRTLAQGGGTLVGAIVNGLVRTWVADNDGQLTLVMWPENFRARLDLLEIIDNHDQTVARGGRVVLLAGGYLKTQHPRSLGHQRVFSAWQASEPDDPAGTRRRPRSRRRPFRDTRLPTTQDEVADISTAVAQACAQASWVQAAFICRVRRDFSDDGSVQTFLAAFMVTNFPSEERPTSSRQLLASLPSQLQDGGTNVLTENAVPNTEPLGVQVYARSELGRPE
jgi:hypothetical protein